MSFKKILIVFLSLIVLCSIGIFALVSSMQVNAYFSDYVEEAYQKNVANIKDYAILGLQNDTLHRSTLNSYVEDPIYNIDVYDAAGAFAIDSVPVGGGMSRGNMMGGHSNMTESTFEFDDAHMLKETYLLESEGKTIGRIVITREKSIVDTQTIQLFKNSLLSSGLISMGASLVIAAIVLFLVVRLMNRGISDVVDYVQMDIREKHDYKIKELNIIAQAIHDYRLKLAQKERVKKQKLDKILHDTKTPLTIMKSQLEGIEDGIMRADEEAVETLLKSTEDLEGALKDIGSVVEGRQIKESVTIEKTDYAVEIDKLIKSLKPKFAAKGLGLEMNPDPFVVETDKAVLNRVVYNLIMNSYKYTQDGKVEVITNEENQTLTIRDTGVGIPEKNLNNVFEPYYRGDNIRDISGEGLGLSIVKELLDSIGAQISVMSQVNEYTMFMIRF